MYMNAEASTSTGALEMPGLRLVSPPRTAQPAIADDADAIVSRAATGRRRVRQGETLYRDGAPFQSLYVVSAGTFKTVILDIEGRDQVTGFHMAGEILGLDGIECGAFRSSAVALEDGDAWEVPFARLEDALCADRALAGLFHRLMSGEIRRDCRMMLLLGSMRAEERMAAFLLDLSGRQSARGYSGVRFLLRMSRREIGSYLGLTLETVSRVFSRMQARGVLRARSKSIEIVDAAALRATLGAGEACAA